MYRRAFLAFVLIPAVMSQEGRTLSLFYKLYPAAINSNDGSHESDTTSCGQKQDPSNSDSSHDSPSHSDDVEREQSRELSDDANNDKISPVFILLRKADLHSTRPVYDPPPIYSSEKSDVDPSPSMRMGPHDDSSKYNPPSFNSRRQSQHDDGTKHDPTPFNPAPVHSRKQDYRSNGYDFLVYLFSQLGFKNEPIGVNEQSVETEKREESLEQDTNASNDTLPNSDGEVFSKSRKSHAHIVNKNVNINKNILDHYDAVISI